MGYGDVRLAPFRDDSREQKFRQLSPDGQTDERGISQTGGGGPGHDPLSRARTGRRHETAARRIRVTSVTPVEILPPIAREKQKVLRFLSGIGPLSRTWRKGALGSSPGWLLRRSDEVGRITSGDNLGICMWTHGTCFQDGQTLAFLARLDIIISHIATSPHRHILIAQLPLTRRVPGFFPAVAPLPTQSAFPPRAARPLVGGWYDRFARRTNCLFRASPAV